MRHPAFLLLLVLLLGASPDGFKAKDPEARRAAVEAVREWTEETAGALAALVSSSEDPGVLVAVARVAGNHAGSNPKALDLLRSLLGLSGKGLWRVRGEAAAALVRSGHAPSAEPAARDEDGRVPQMLCEALGAVRIKSAQDFQMLGSLARHEDWRVRAAAIEALGDSQGIHDAVPLLIDRLRSETGRLAGDAHAALRKVTGEDLPAAPEAWVAWLARKKGLEAAGAATAAGEEARTPDRLYHGVGTRSHRMIFVFDTSNSMAKEDRIGKERRHLVEAIRSLEGKGEGKCYFNLLTFSDGVDCWKETLVPASEQNKREAIAFLEAQKLSKQTNTWAALKVALDMAQGEKPRAKSLGPADIPQVLDPDEMDLASYDAKKEGADTLFLMTDGRPWVGGEAADWEKIADQVRDCNRTKRVVIHAIGVGSQVIEPFLRRLAEESGGTYVHVP